MFKLRSRRVAMAKEIETQLRAFAETADTKSDFTANKLEEYPKFTREKIEEADVHADET